MDRMEMVEQLKGKTGVSYSDAKEALEKSDWDMLGATILLENEGKIEKDSASASSSGAENEEKYDAVVATASGKNDRAGKIVEEMKEFLEKLLRLLCKNFLIVRRKNEVIVKIPLLVLAILCWFCVQAILTMLLIGLFIGCGYCVEGENFRGATNATKMEDAFEREAEER